MEFGFYFYFKKITVYGKEKIPKDGGVILSPNHQNGIIDPFIVGADYGGTITSLTRADVFGGSFHWLFTAMNMIPIYRIRDGFSSLKNNDTIFDKCYDLLGSGKPLQIFSEGRQHENYFLIPISKGSSRLALNAQKKNLSKNIYIIPVGINYSNRRNPLSFIHLVYGDPILIKNYIDDNIPEVKQINNIRDALSNGMKKCLWLPNKSDDYSVKCSVINNLKGNESFKEIRNMVDNAKEFRASRPLNFLEKIIGSVGSILNAPVLLITKIVLSKFDDVVYYSTVKFYCGLFLLPLWWMMILISVSFIDFRYSILTLFAIVISLYIRQNNRNIIFNR
tara:strand:+ start:824 stop:1828 length:1005 start_codon:yes stop_codon:yes gene_type:complete